jgi:hypothetical protein
VALKADIGHATRERFVQIAGHSINQIVRNSLFADLEGIGIREEVKPLLLKENARRLLGI